VPHDCTTRVTPPYLTKATRTHLQVLHRQRRGVVAHVGDVVVRAQAGVGLGCCEQQELGLVGGGGGLRWAEGGEKGGGVCQWLVWWGPLARV
jgi:hypothetical protein